MLQVIAKFRDQNEGLTALVVGACAERNPSETRRLEKPDAMGNPENSRFSVLLRDDQGGLVQSRIGLTLTEAVQAARCFSV